MKTNQMNDERVINEKRKITTEAYGLIMIFLLILDLGQYFGHKKVKFLSSFS